MGVVVQLRPDAPEPKRRPFGSIRRRRGSRHLWVRFRYLGRLVEQSTGLDDTPENEARVRAFLDRIGDDIRAGTFRFEEAFPGAPEEQKILFARLAGREYRRDPATVAVGDYLTEWVERHLAAEPSETKRRDYRSIIAHHLAPRFGGVTFADLTGVEVVAFVRELRARGLSTSRIRNILIPLRVVWEDAAEQYGWELRNPFEHLKRRNRSGRLIPPRSRAAPEAFHLAEWRALLAAMDPWWAPVAELLVHTGMIASEVARLRWADVTADGIVVRGTKTQYRHRVLPITPPLSRVLETLRARADGDLVATRKSGAPFDATRWRHGPWARGIAKAGIAYRRPYATRHTFALWHLVAGTHPEALVSLMGHGSKQMVYEVYGKYSPGMAEQADQIRAYLGLDRGQK